MNLAESFHFFANGDLNTPLIQLIHGDTLRKMRDLPDASIDFICADLPYGVTRNAWDKKIPFAPLWTEYKRIIKPNGAIALTAAQPFSSELVMSNQKMHRYEIVWEKTKKTGFLNARRQPLRNHETVQVFYKAQPTYNPQGVEACDKITRRGSTGGNYGATGNEYRQTQTNYPGSVWKIPSEGNTVNATQKPVALFERLILTFTNPGDVVLDNTVGSGTSLVACWRTGRRGIGIEGDPVEYAKAIARLSHEMESRPYGKA